jgi:hypothetical protein
LAWPTASQFHAAQDVQSLGKLFGVARQLLVNRWQLTFTTHRENRGQLAGLDLQFQIRLRLDDRNLTSSWAAFKTPQMSAPPFEGKLDAPERQALIQISANLPAPAIPLVAETVAVRRALIFASFGGLLAFLWFAVPLVLWPSPKTQSPSQTGLVVPKPQASGISPRETLPASTAVPSPAQPPAQQGSSETQIQFEAHSSPDRTVFDPRGQETHVCNPDDRIAAELPGHTKVQLTPALEQPAATVGPDATLILDRLPDQNKPGQTQIQFVLPPQHSSPDRTLLDPRGQETVVVKPGESVKVELTGKAEIRVTPIMEQPDAPASPDATLILDRLPDQDQPGQTQIQFVVPPQRNSADRTLLDPRGQQTVVLKPDDTVIDPRGEQTVIISPQDKPPTKT